MGTPKEKGRAPIVRTYKERHGKRAVKVSVYPSPTERFVDLPADYLKHRDVERST